MADKKQDEPQVRMGKLSEFTQLQDNPNAGSERGQYMLEVSNEKFGAWRSIAATKDGVIAAGNHFAEVFGANHEDEDVIVVKTAGDKLVIVQREDINSDDPRAKEYAVADNRTSEVGLQWDAEVLAGLVVDEDIALDDLFFDSELKALLPPSEPLVDPEPQLDRAAELQEIWQVASGNIWEIPSQSVPDKAHRLACGDCTDADVAARLMGGERAEMLFTSPPYADQRDYGGHDLSHEIISGFIPLFKPFAEYQCVNLGIKRSEGAIVRYWDIYIKVAENCGLRLLSWNVWDKLESGSIGNQSAMFAIEHEWIFVFGERPRDLNRTVEHSPSTPLREKYTRHDNNGRAIRSRRQADGTMKHSTRGDMYQAKQLATVLRVSPEKRTVVRQMHPATMGPDVPAGYIEAVTDQDDIVIDPFLGSGTTMVAAERTGRICYGVEIEPKYCAVILQRLTDMGLEPRRNS